MFIIVDNNYTKSIKNTQIYKINSVYLLGKRFIWNT